MERQERQKTASAGRNKNLIFIESLYYYSNYLTEKKGIYYDFFLYFCTMQSIPSYIAYLLTKHECVILPGLGAFIVSCAEESKDEHAGLLCPPAKFLGFNSDIRHNDGLLANAIARGEDSTYKEACQQISRYVDRVTHELEQQIPLQIAWVGKLELSFDRKLLFTPSQQPSCNAGVFGMSNFYLPAVAELNKRDEQPVRTPVHPSFVRRTLAIAATILGLLMVSIPVTDHSIQHPQTATLFSLPPIASREPVVEKPVEVPVEVEVITPYYIVVASLPSESLAQKQIELLSKRGLSDLGIISAGHKHRVYVAKFSDKAEANTFLLHFRNEYPFLHDAWLLIQRK
jgi:hypothetical protein